MEINRQIIAEAGSPAVFSCGVVHNRSIMFKIILGKTRQFINDLSRSEDVILRSPTLVQMPVQDPLLLEIRDLLLELKNQVPQISDVRILKTSKLQETSQTFIPSIDIEDPDMILPLKKTNVKKNINQIINKLDQI